MYVSKSVFISENVRFCLHIFITLHCLRQVVDTELAPAMVSYRVGDFLHRIGGMTLSSAMGRAYGG